MAITLVASVTAAPGANGGATAAITTTGATLLVLSASWYSGAITVTDSNGNTWTPLTVRTHGTAKHQLFYALAPTVGTGHTFTVAGTGIYPAIIVQAFTAPATLAYQVETGATGGSPLATGSVTPATNGALVVTGRVSNTATTADAVSPGGFAVLTVPYGASTNMVGAAAYYEQPTAAAINPTWTWTGSSSENAAGTVVFAWTVAAAVARVQATPPVLQTSPATSIAVTFSTPPAIGHGVVVAVIAAGATAATSCTDTHGHTYTLAIAQDDGSSDALAIYVCASVAATGAPFTITLAGASLYRSAIAIEYDAPLAIDQTAGASGTGPTAAVGPTAALTGADAVLVAVAITGGSTIFTVLTGGWGQELEDLVAPPTGEVASRVLGGAAGLTPSVSWALNGAHFWGAAIAAFTAGASAPPVDEPPVYVVSIGEVEVVPLLATFRIQETIDAPDTMIADVFSVAPPPALPAYQARILADGASAYWPLDDPSGTTARDLVGADDPVPFVRFALGQAVVVTENGVRIFGGVVTGTRERGLTGPSATDLVVEIQATSYELSAARRVITAAISQDGAETIGAAFATLVTDYYAEVGVSLHPSQSAGPALPAATFTRVRGDGVNKQLASSVGYLQSIDFENRLRAWAPGDVLAPDNYDEAVNPELLTGDITVERQLQNGYANRVILVGDPIPVPDHKDSFTGDGVTPTWPITYQVTGPFPYFVDGAVAFGVVEYPATSTTESIGGVESPPGFLWEYDPIALTIHRRSGPVAAGVAFDFRYHGVFIPAGMAEDAAEIAALGLWEHVENVTAVITDVSAQEYANALLAAKLASKDEIVRLQTRALGFHPGQTMTIASVSRALSGDYLIAQVDTGSESGGILLVRSITASKSQNNTHDWRRVYQQWAGATDSGAGTLGIGFSVGDLADLVARSGVARSDATRSGYLG